MKNGEQLELNLLGFVASRLVEKGMIRIPFEKGLAEAKDIVQYAGKITPWVDMFLRHGFKVLYHPICDAHGADVIIRYSGQALGIDITCREDKPPKPVYMWRERTSTHARAMGTFHEECWPWPISTASAADVIKARVFVAGLTGKKGREAFQ